MKTTVFAGAVKRHDILEKLHDGKDCLFLDQGGNPELLILQDIHIFRRSHHSKYVLIDLRGNTVYSFSRRVSESRTLSWDKYRNPGEVLKPMVEYLDTERLEKKVALLKIPFPRHKGRRRKNFRRHVYMPYM
ncbi:MAG TPA: hypothetical protein VFA52_02175 [Candidatus Paceibacterota bacterium]|nr:hypothetical protein [Candidatus Paceibacterota bacterium]